MIDTINFKVNFNRKRKPKRLFSKDEIKKVLENGNDYINNTLAVDMNGYVHLAPEGEIDLTQYAVRYDVFCAYSNYVGKYSHLYHLEDTYKGSLEAWLEHLKYDEQIHKDYNDNGIQKMR